MLIHILQISGSGDWVVFSVVVISHGSAFASYAYLTKRGFEAMDVDIRLNHPNMAESLPANRPQIEKPAVITKAVRLLYLSLAIGGVRVLLEWANIMKSEFPIYTLLLEAVIVGLLLWLFDTIGKGRNWARITLLVLQA